MKGLRISLQKHSRKPLQKHNTQKHRVGGFMELNGGVMFGGQMNFYSKTAL